MEIHKHKPIILLYAEDDEEDQMLVKDAFQESNMPNEIHFVPDGEELMNYLNREGKYENLHNSSLPGLILLDLNMPKKDGREAIKEIRSNPKFCTIPIIVLTTSKTEEDIFLSYKLGVNSFIKKPVTFDALVEIVKTLNNYWFETVELPDVNKYNN